MADQWYVAIDGISQRVVDYLPLLGAFHSPNTSGSFWLPLLLCADQTEAIAVVDALRQHESETLRIWEAEIHCDPLMQHAGGDAALIAVRANSVEAYARNCPLGADGWPLLPIARHAILFRDAIRQITASPELEPDPGAEVDVKSEQDGPQPTGTETKKATALHNSTPPAEELSRWRGPLEGTRAQLSEWCAMDDRTLFGLPVFCWIFKVKKGSYRIWFANQGDLTAASGRKEAAPTNKNKHQPTRTRTTSKKQASK
jgi:hypothetical protein